MDKRNRISKIEGKTIKEAAMWQNEDGDMVFEATLTNETTFAIRLERVMPIAEMVLMEGGDLEVTYERTFKGKIQD